MNRTLSEFILADMLVQYVVNDEGTIGFEILPTELKDKVQTEKRYRIDPLVQVSVRGDDFSGAFSNGHTMRNGQSVKRLKYHSQSVEQSQDVQTITTTLKTDNGQAARHILTHRAGSGAFVVKTVYSNEGNSPISLEMLSSFSFGGLTPFVRGSAPDTMRVHRLRSSWSNEGRLVTESVEDMQLEPAWAPFGVRTERFGQIGSMPVRKFFPFVAVEDTGTHVTWAAQLACASSWQLELYRSDDGLCVSGGLADYEFGHWMKILEPNESLETPSATITVGTGGVDEVSQRLLCVQKDAFNRINRLDSLPVVFNEYCTTWGTPSHENICRIVDIIKSRGLKYFVIDAGWYADKENGWSATNGDWNVSPELFPLGLEKTVQTIREAGLLPGIWFEFENCAELSKAYTNTDHLLKRNGHVITSGARRFWDMSDPWVVDYLTEKVISMLKKYGFKYIKVDYNDTIGIGCDGVESLGEGLRQRVLATQAFFRKIREEIPDIMIENCSSGGHRLEPSMMALCDMASFSDAHECKEIPVIAANLHRTINPCQSQIWAVLRKDDTPKRIVYSIVNTFLGVMCLSGDVYNLNRQQWDLVDAGIKFYQAVSPIIQNGVTRYFGPKITSYRDLKGWQGILRTQPDGREAVAVFHTFGSDFPETLQIPIDGGFAVSDVYCANGNRAVIRGNSLSVSVHADFEAIAVHLKRNDG